MGRIGNSRKKGQLAIVGKSQKFFQESQLHEMNQWIIDQLTLGSAPVEIWDAEKSPFRDDLVKIRLVKQY